MRYCLAKAGAAIAWILLLTGSVNAAPLFSATTTLDLGSMAVTTTGDLRLNWGEPVFRGWVADGTGSYWLFENEFGRQELGAYSEVSIDDLRYFDYGPNYGPYSAHADSYASLRLPFATEGSGYLGLAIPFHAEYDTGPYPDPDNYGGGPDFCHGSLTLVNGEEQLGLWENYTFDSFQVDKPDTYDYLLRGGDLWFDAGDTGYLNLFAYAESMVYYWQVPTAVDGGGQTPVPTPEPATFLLFGAGLLGGVLARRKRQ